jgi:uncharacterized protein (TIGR02246 family)
MTPRLRRALATLAVVTAVGAEGGTLAVAATGAAVEASAPAPAPAPAIATRTARASVCSPTPAARRSADIEAICAQGRAWIRAFKGGDIDGLMRLYMPDAQVALHGQRKLDGLAAIRAFFAPALAARPDVQFLLDVEDIQVQGDVAWLVSGYWYTSVGRDGQRYEDAGRSLLIYRRDRSGGGAGEWKIQVDLDQATPDVTFPPPPGAL